MADDPVKTSVAWQVLLQLKTIWRDADLWLCGPAGFGQVLKKGLVALGLPPARFFSRNCSRCGDRENRAPPRARNAQYGRPM